MHPERITQKDKELTNDLHYDEIKLPADKEDFSKIEKKNKKKQCLQQCVWLGKQADFYNFYFRSKIWKFKGFVAFN